MVFVVFLKVELLVEDEFDIVFEVQLGSHVLENAEDLVELGVDDVLFANEIGLR